MAIARFGRLAKRSYKSYGFCVRLTAVVILGLCFIFVWSVFSTNSFSVTSRRETFDDIAEPISGNGEAIDSWIQLKRKEIKNDGKEDEEDRKIQTLGGEGKKKIYRSPPLKSGNGNKDQKQVAKGKNVKAPKEVDKEKVQVTERSEDEDLQEEKKDEDSNSNEEETDNGEGNEEDRMEGDSDLGNTLDLDQENVEEVEDDSRGSEVAGEGCRVIGIMKEVAPKPLLCVLSLFPMMVMKLQ